MLTAREHPRTAGYQNGGVGRIRLVEPPAHRSFLLTRPVVLALVATLVLGLIGGIAAAWRFTIWGDSGPSRGGPAILAPGTPSPESISGETLVDITLPADVVGGAETGYALITYEVMAADTVSTSRNLDCCPGALVHLILSGSASVTSDGLMQLIRHDAPDVVIDIAPGDTADLGPGDALIVRSEDVQTWTSGGEPVGLISQVLVASPVPGFGPAGMSLRDSEEAVSVPLPEGPYRLRLRRSEFTADAEFALPGNGIVQLAVIEEGRASIGRRYDGAIVVSGVQAPTTVLILGLDTGPEGIGTPVAGPSTP